MLFLISWTKRTRVQALKRDKHFPYQGMLRTLLSRTFCFSCVFFITLFAYYENKRYIRLCHAACVPLLRTLLENHDDSINVTIIRGLFELDSHYVSWLYRFSPAEAFLSDKCQCHLVIRAISTPSKGYRENQHYFIQELIKSKKKRISLKYIIKKRRSNLIISN